MRKVFLKIAAIFLLGALLLTMPSCNITSSNPTVSSADLLEELIDETPKDVTLNTALLKSYETFAIEFLKKSVKDLQNDNRLISPLSCFACLALIANGSDSNTKAEFEQVLGMSLEDLNTFYYALNKQLSDQSSVKLELANSIWFKDAEALQIEDSFLRTLAEWYDAQAYKVPFDASTVEDINNWCSLHTDEMIEKIIDDVDADTMMYLINALVFDAEWAEKYEGSDIKDGTFTTSTKTEQKVTFLSSIESTYFEDTNTIGTMKTYKGGQFAFVGLLPKDTSTSLTTYLESFTSETWSKLWETRSYEYTVTTKIPEFTFSDDIDLNEILQAMGLCDAFTQDADFTPMGNFNGSSLILSKVEQKTKIEVDANGTKAAAITWGEMKCTSAGPSYERTVVLNRPFVYLIIDTSTGIPLFMGVMNSI